MKLVACKYHSFLYLILLAENLISLTDVHHFHVFHSYYKMDDNENAIKWFNMLSSRVPTDPGVLYDLGTLYAKENDESQSYNSYLESYRYYPINIDVTSWLGLYFVKHKIYEKALTYFERATQIQPNEVNWQLMVASCHRRIGSYQQAKRCYEQIHLKYPDNVECLRYLIQICTDYDLKKEKKIYTKQLIELEERLRLKKNGEKNEEGEDDDEPHPAYEDDAVQKAKEHKEQQEQMILMEKKYQEDRLRDQQELERLRAIEAEYLAMMNKNNNKKGVKFVESDDPSRKINDKKVESNDDEFMGIDDGIDDLYS